ncbi:DUF6185 family protein [Streptomyces sp. FXJ1.172]|uniref:DUF6185 family protein n=1 Tax=Streptomyces sp. FXJ1.172 TaxID=710705 RepID=UPI0008372918|nr:DUF6185 family protein [Streptomyces sp. FXJ1.172]WEO95518.1 DUF6185 family protein [Streptomyces sp. FXJ1.172]
MKGIQWRRFLLLMTAVMLWWGCSPAEARENSSASCSESGLDTTNTKVDATIQFDEYAKGDYVRIRSDMTVTLPLHQWRLARNLTHSEDSREYRIAMHCLLRGSDNSEHNEEWRTQDPVVSFKGDKVHVDYESLAVITNYNEIQLGPWDIKRQGGKTWQVFLHPHALQKADWEHVDADLGGLHFNDRSGLASSSTEKELVWQHNPPTSIQLEVDLPWQRSWILSYSQSSWSTAGVAAWWVCASIVIALAALRTQRESRAGATGRPSDGPTQAVLQWAVLSGAVALMLILLNSQKPVSPHGYALVCIAAGLALILVARPWCASALVTDVPRTAKDAGATVAPASLAAQRRRQAHAVIGSASAVAAVGLLVALAPELFGLPPTLVSKGAPTVSSEIGYVLVGLATVWLWLAAMTAWAWRFGREGALLPAAWTARWDKAPVRCAAVVSALLAVVAAGLLAYLVWDSENQWKRVTWLTDQNTGAKHGQYVSHYLGGFAGTELTWVFSYSWVLTGVALLALLHIRARSPRPRSGRKREMPALGPEGPDLLLTAVVFAFTAGLQGASLAGNSAQYSLWLILNIASLFAVLTAGRRWSVLSELGPTFYVKRLSTKKRRRALMAKAHEYRSVNHQLELLDQGRVEGVTREQLEGQLHGLRRWLVGGCGQRNPPDHISVLETALAWGPDRHWWANAVHTARLAFCFGLPASAVLLYLKLRDPWDLLQLTSEPTGIPGVVASLIAYQVAWAAAGFVLGALWRLLPGRRSVVRAWSVTFAYAVPACLAVLLNRFTDVDFTILLFYSVLMLTILTLTSIWMDTSTFRKERQYWPSRFALLLSIYQLRGFSGQVAWLLAQVGAAAAIYHEVARG